MLVPSTSASLMSVFSLNSSNSRSNNRPMCSVTVMRPNNSASLAQDAVDGDHPVFLRGGSHTLELHKPAARRSPIVECSSKTGKKRRVTHRQSHQNRTRLSGISHRSGELAPCQAEWNFSSNCPVPLRGPTAAIPILRCACWSWPTSADERGGEPSALLELSSRPLLAANADNLDAVMARLAPKLRLTLNGGAGGAALTIGFAQLDDFHPDALYQRLELFQSLRRSPLACSIRPASPKPSPN